ncbi:hypothetical protein [Terriglobus sp.]|uniref:hypothetical protein n=1 Tax=Terriglobus sp. TaxID=1889013 RepID=UPI003B0066E3
MTRPTPHQLTPYAVILTAALLATLPLLLYGPSCGHDLPFHMLNWMDAAHQWRTGTLRPWWCAPAAWNAGEPRFLFYPPVSWVFGALLTLILGATHAPVAYTFLALTASGITMRRFLASYVTPPLALLGACFYLAHPYLLFTATERTAYAELLAAAWLPWLLHEALRERINPSRLAIPVALLWLTNTPSAVLGTYTLAVLLAIRTILAIRSAQPVLKPLLLPATLGYLWGIALSALYLLPALVQHNAVEVGQAFTSGMRPEDSTLFTHTGEPLHDHVVHQASVLAVILLGTAVIAALIRLAGHRRAHRLHKMRDLILHRTHNPQLATLTPTFLTLTALTAFLLTPASLFLWHHLPELQFLQFPWRTLMLQGIVTVTLIVLAVRTPLRTRWAVPIALLAVAALSFTAHHSYAQFCDDEDAPSSLLAQYNRGAGFEPYDEYTPKDANNDLLHPNEPPAWTATGLNDPPPSSAAGIVFSPTEPISPANRPHIQIDTTTVPNSPLIWVQPTPTDHFLILRQHRFPNRPFLLDNRELTDQYFRDDGLIAVPLPNTGRHMVYIVYEQGPDVYAGLLISGIAALALAVALRNHRYRTRYAPEQLR